MTALSPPRRRRPRATAASRREGGGSCPGARRSSARRGFTLLEMILAVTITGVVSVTMFTSLRIAFEAREQAVDRLAGRHTARATLDRLAEDLQGVLEPDGRIAGPFVGIDAGMGFTREADVLNFVTTGVALPTGEEVGDLRGVELALVEDPNDPDTGVLVRYVTTNLMASTTPEPVAQVLARGIVSLNFRYYDGGDWLDAWDSTQQDNALPAAVEVSLTVRPVRQRIEDNEEPEDHDLTMVRVVMLPGAPEPATSEGGTQLFGF